MTSSALTHLFVYGTLAPGEANAHILSPLTGTWQPASIRGHLMPHGCGAASGFPAVILDRQGEIIRGQVFSSSELIQHWQRIDDFEGEGYQRVPVTVELADGSQLETSVYELHPNERP